jgi:hypothetical protein
MVEVVWIYERLREYSEERGVLGDLGGVREEALVPPPRNTPCQSEPPAGVAFAFYCYFFFLKKVREIDEFEKVLLCLRLVYKNRFFGYKV